jgi:hypothetical protein
MSLTDSLEALVEEHDRIGSPLRERLAPGAPDELVDSTIRALGLSPPAELVELFAWHEVRDNPGDKWRTTWFWPASPFTLIEAVDEYRHAMEIGGVTPAELERHVAAAGPGSTLTGFWRSDWFPILDHGEGAVQCAINGETLEGSPVWRQNWHPNENFQAALLAPTLTDYVDRIVELFRAGGYQWNAEDQAIVTVDEVFDRRGLGATLRPWP